MLEKSSPFQSLIANAPDTTEFKKLHKRLIRMTQDALTAYDMIHGQRWLVCLSGGKDSYTLLVLLLELQWRGVLPVDLLACNLDQKQPDFPEHVLPEWFGQHGIPFRIEQRDTFSVVTEKNPEGKTYCSLCSRLRRANLYRVAREENCQAIVLGHHADDILATFFLNMFYGGRLESMPPKLLNDEGDLCVLRPLSFCFEKDIRVFSDKMQFPIIPCNLCGTQEGLQRKHVQGMLDQWELQAPGRKETLLRALQNIRPSHLMDSEVFDFTALGIKRP
jgi:tRNA 2-thiocytidine biosynthesis protein TtcA